MGKAEVMGASEVVGRSQVTLDVNHEEKQAWKFSSNISLSQVFQSKDKVGVGTSPHPQVLTIWSSLIQLDQVWSNLI